MERVVLVVVVERGVLVVVEGNCGSRNGHVTWLMIVMMESDIGCEAALTGGDGG